MWVCVQGYHGWRTSIGKLPGTRSGGCGPRSGTSARWSVCVGPAWTPPACAWPSCARLPSQHSMPSSPTPQTPSLVSRAVDRLLCACMAVAGSWQWLCQVCYIWPTLQSTADAREALQSVCSFCGVACDRSPAWLALLARGIHHCCAVLVTLALDHQGAVMLGAKTSLQAGQHQISWHE